MSDEEFENEPPPHELSRDNILRDHLQHNEWEQALIFLDSLDKGDSMDIQSEHFKEALIFSFSAPDEVAVKLLRKYVDFGLNISDPVSSGLSSIHYAALCSSRSVMEYFLNDSSSGGLHADPNIPGPEGETPLQLTAQQDDDQILRILLENGADPFMRSGSQLTAVSEFALFQKKKSLEMIYEKYPESEKFSESLVLTALSRNFEIMSFLLEKGCDSDSILTDNRALILVMNFLNTDSDNSKLVFEFMKTAEINPEGFSALFWATAFGRLESVKKLLACGCSPEGVTETEQNSGLTPVMIAAVRGDEKVLGLLLDKGANSKSKDATGKSALDLLEEYGKLTEHRKCLRILRKR